MPEPDDEKQDLTQLQQQITSSPIVRRYLNSTTWKNEEDVIVVSGYLREPLNNTDAVPEWRWILYRTLDLDEYIEFNWADVLHIENYSYKDPPPQPPAQPPTHDKAAPTEPVVIWFNASARINRVQHFLIGDIANLYMPHADLAARLGSIQDLAQVYGGRSWGGCTNNLTCGGH